MVCVWVDSMRAARDETSRIEMHSTLDCTDLQSLYSLPYTRNNVSTSIIRLKLIRTSDLASQLRLASLHHTLPCRWSIIIIIH
jgi:hypothetical protein